MKGFLSGISGIIAFVTFLLAIGLFFDSNSSGLIPGFGRWLALLVLASGNAITFIPNILLWKLYGAPRWFKVTVCVQAFPAIIMIGVFVLEIYDLKHEAAATRQSSRIAQAINNNDLAAFTRAQAMCGTLCRTRLSMGEQLVAASDSRSLDIAKKLVSQSVTVKSYPISPTESLHTCEGDYIASMSALSIAVARNDPDMVHLLFPVSDESARFNALWLAARLDRLKLVKAFVKKGMPLNIRGNTRRPNDTLLVAAASGAALKVGHWLIDVHHMPVNAIAGDPTTHPGRAPLTALFGFMDSVPDSSRIPPFARMLVAHGANVDASTQSGETLLQQAIRTRRKDEAQLLLASGASTPLLGTEQHKALTKLLFSPDQPVYPPNPDADCVKVSSESGAADSRQAL